MARPTDSYPRFDDPRRLFVFEPREFTRGPSTISCSCLGLGSQLTSIRARGLPATAPNRPEASLKTTIGYSLHYRREPFISSFQTLSAQRSASGLAVCESR